MIRTIMLLRDGMNNAVSICIRNDKGGMDKEG